MFITTLMPYKDAETTKIKSREYYLKNKERIKQKVREYRTNNRDLVLEKRKEYVQRNKDKIDYWIKNNRQKINETRKKWYYKNRDKMLEYMRNWMNENYEEYRLRRDAYEEANKDMIVENRKQYYETHRPIKLEYSKRRFRYKDKKLIAPTNPRKGICFFCEEKNILTHIHHMKYDDENPLDFTIELCVSCHRKMHMIFPTPKGYISPRTLPGEKS